MNTMNRWTTWTFVAAAVAAPIFSSSRTPSSANPASTSPVVVTVYKSASCGCCRKWMDHLTANGFAVTGHDTSDVALVKNQYGVPQALRSCHTAIVGGYVIEGHVPAADIKRLLRERPKIAGLAVPGMVTGSPGMEMGNTADRYDVIAFGDGKTSVYASH
jgi:hypothetical protein